MGSDDELDAIRACVETLAKLQHNAAIRVVAYLASHHSRRASRLLYDAAVFEREKEQEHAK